MENMLNFFIQNYIWFVAIIATILLAIIGYYADKTNFGQGYNNDKSDEEDQELIDLSNVKLSTFLGVERKKDNKVSESEINVNNIYNEYQNTNNGRVENKEPLSNEQIDIIASSNESNITLNLNNNNDLSYNLDTQLSQKDIEFKKFEEEFDEIIPKKTIVDELMLEEIENLSLDKTQKINISDIPDVDDVDLPRIKSMEKIDEDIWKF